jgi:hypothetical protein
MYILALKLIFLNPKYLALSIGLSAMFLVLLLITAEFLFFEPILSFSFLGDFPNLLLIILTSVLTGIVIPMSIYRIILTRNSVKRSGSGFLGSVIGSIAGVCGCGSIGFSIISTFGAVGGIATAFLSNYEVHLRILAIAILGFAFFSTLKAVSQQCTINPKR